MGKVKGSIVAKVVKALRSQSEEARKRVPGHLHHYFDGRVLSTTWHDEEDYLALMTALAGLLPDQGMDVWEFMGRDSAKRDFEDIYSSLVQGSNAAGSLRGLQTYWRLRHDTGSLTVDVDGAGKAVVELKDYVLVSDEIFRSIGGTLWAVLDYAGATQIEVQRTLCTTRGDDRVRWDLTWLG